MQTSNRKKNALGHQNTKPFCNMVIINCRELCCSCLNKFVWGSKAIIYVDMLCKLRRCSSELRQGNVVGKTILPQVFQNQSMMYLQIINGLIILLTFKHLHFISCFHFTPFFICLLNLFSAFSYDPPTGFQPRDPDFNWVSLKLCWS